MSVWTISKSLLRKSLLVAALGAGLGAGAAELAAGFDPAQWPGRMTPEVSAALIPHADALVAAMNAQDRQGVTDALKQVKEALGPYAGVPEVKPEYGAPINDDEPDLDRVEALWFASFKRMQGHHGWDLASPADAEYQKGPRLRVSLRHARAYLQSHDAQLPQADAFLECARKGFDYILTAQGSNGCFGYPYNPGGPGLTTFAAQIVQKELDQGRKLEDIVENGWIIDVRGDGGLQFDNGMCGIGLLYAYAKTGHKPYLEAARRAGEWAIRQPLVLNWNYNGFSGYLLARLYRVTGESRYLDEARKKIEFGVMPGQMENGRWLDPHNARIQYHSVMIRDMIEYYLALKQAQDPGGENVAAKIKLGLDNLAAQITTYGASNFHEMLSLDALSLGILTFGENAEWVRACNVNVNYLMDHAREQLEARQMPMTETVASYLLYRRAKKGGVSATELASHLGLEK